MNENFGTLAFFRQRQSNRVYEIVIRALEKASIDLNMNRKDIAKYLGVPPSQVSRLLSGPSNWTLNTLSDLMTVIGAEIEFNVVWNKDRRRPNFHHELNQQAVISHQTPISFTTPTTVAANSTYILSVKQ